MILNGWICREPCRVCGGPVIEIQADESTIMRVCLVLISPGRSWFAWDSFEGGRQPGDERLLNIPPQHEILTLIHERHAEAARAMEAAEEQEEADAIGFREHGGGETPPAAGGGSVGRDGAD